MRRIAAIIADLILVVLFAALGRASHDEPLDFTGLQRTALPFIAGTLLIWVWFILKHRTGLTLRDGVYVWITTVVLGVAFRVMLGNTAAPSFVLVTTIVLAAFLIGWRAVRWLIVRPRGGSSGTKAKDPRRSGNPAKRNAA